jgi:purine-cytosine permease-like protein
VIDLIDTVLVLLIIVEVFQTVIAFSRDEPVTRIVITAALIAIARKVISFRPEEFGSTEEAFLSAITFSVLLAVLIAGFYVVKRVDRAAVQGLRPVPPVLVAVEDHGDGTILRFDLSDTDVPRSALVSFLRATDSILASQADR